MRVGGWIPTFTGRKFYPLDPRLEDITIEDIAHHLSMQVRWTGAVQTFYSTAQHSVLVSYACPPEDAFWALLHDASEAYLHDINRILKHAPQLAGYRNIEDGLQLLIYARFGLVGPVPRSVKVADDLLAETERRDLVPRGTPDMDADPARCAEWVIRPVAQDAAEQMFLARFRQLWSSVEQADNRTTSLTEAR